MKQTQAEQAAIDGVESAQDANGKRGYRRRSDDARIAELEARIHEIKAKLEAKKAKLEAEKRRISPAVLQIPKVEKKLNKFRDLALEHQRHDIANSVMGFTAVLRRIYDTELSPEPERARRADHDD